MPTLLHLDASPRGNLSISRQLSAAAVAAWKDKYPGGKVIERDLTETEITFVDLDWIIDAFSTPDQLTDRPAENADFGSRIAERLFAPSRIIRSLAPHSRPAHLRAGQLFSKCFRVAATRLRKAQRRLFS
jgi:FMN-dependent NADH-azoreductase